MVYNTGPEGLLSVRMETGNILPEEYPDTELTLKLQGAFSRIQLNVGRLLTDPFISPDDVEFDFARELELKIAARDALKAYGSEFEAKVRELTEEITADLAFLKENVQEVADTGDVNILTSVTSYLSFNAAMDENPLQTAVVPYRSGLTDSV
jgi:hypothetical protein